MHFVTFKCLYLLFCCLCGFRGLAFLAAGGMNCRSKPLPMSISTVSSAQFTKLVPSNVTPDQWRAYWGVNKVDRLQRVLESLLLAYGGAWLSWFLSFLAGGAISSIVGTLLVFNWLYTPWFAAKRNNANIRVLEGSEKPLMHALYVGRISRMERARRKMPGTVSAVVSQNFLVLSTADEEDRALEIVTPWRDSYSQLRVGMTYSTIIASTQADYSAVDAITDGYTPACNLWVGDYPYLHKRRFRRYVLSVAQDETRNSRGSPHQVSFSNTPTDVIEDTVTGTSNSERGNDYDGSSY